MVLGERLMTSRQVRFLGGWIIRRRMMGLLDRLGISFKYLTKFKKRITKVC